MKTAIIYASVHHKNTYKLLEAIKAKYPEVELFDATTVVLKDLVSFDLIGIASGIYFSKVHKSIIPFLEANLPERKKVFLMYTSGARNEFGNELMPVIDAKKCSLAGTFSCPGYDTFGPFKLVGGLNKNHPDKTDCENAVSFFESLQ